jgi:L-malate glycosyltransferase
MHILVISHNYPTPMDPAYGFFCKDQAEALASKGVKIGVVGPLLMSPKNIRRWRLSEFGVKKFKSEKNVITNLLVIPSIPKFPLLRLQLINFFGKRMLNSYVKKYGKPDAIHLQVYLAGDIAIYGSKKYNIPFVWTEHFSNVAQGQYFAPHKKLVNRVLSTAAYRIGVSKFFCLELEKQFGKTFDFVPNVYNDAVFHLPKGTKKISKPFTFINVSYFYPIKNHRRLINAFASLCKEFDVSLKLIGSGDRLQEIKDLVDELGITRNVTFRGELNTQQVFTELITSHAYVLSSDLETFNVSIVEAMACGIPVVATKCGGPQTILDNDSIGVLTEQTVESLARGMKYVYENYSKFNPRDIAAYVERIYSMDAIGSKLHEIMKKVIDDENILE